MSNYEFPCKKLAQSYNGNKLITLSGIGGMCWYGLGDVHRDLLSIAVTSLEDIRDLKECFSNSNNIEFQVTADCEESLKDFSEPWSENPNIWIPSIEKTLVWYQRDGASVPFDDEQLMCALQDYRLFNSSFDKLLEVARSFNREKEMKASIRYSENFDPEFSPFYGFELQDIDK